MEADLTYQNQGALLKTSLVDASGIFGRPMVGINHRRKTRRIDPRIQEHLVALTLVIDSVVILAAMIGAYFLRFHSPLRHLGIQGEMAFGQYINYFAFGTFTMVLLLAHLKFYERNLLLRFKHLVTILAKATCFWTVGFLSATLLINAQPPISRMYGLLAGGVIFGALFLSHALFHRLILKTGVVENLRQRILFVGWNEQTAKIVDSFANAPHSAYHFVGCVTASHGRHCETMPDDVPTLGNVQQLSGLIHEHMVDMVIMSDVDCVKDEIVGLANLCEKELVQFKIIPSYFQILVSGLRLETVSGIPVLGVSQLALDKFGNAIFKRALDVVGAIVGLILSAPLIAIFGFLVYRESPGPIFYRQKRLGRNGAIFDILKIRSMRLDAEVGQKPGWSTKNDPRRLKIGSFMRRWNIDEVPQFWNVLVGEMSLVGPRPERPELIQNFKEEIPHYNARHSVKPGITGWAQVLGLRGDTDLRERINCDLYYLENWNPLFDFQIMLKTFISNKNAA
ncbi:MAG: sugar transferase [Chthoniobacterales bacterium]